MSCTVRPNRHGYLAFRLYWNGIESHEGTKLEDTPENQARLEDRARVITQEMDDGVFEYLRWFPNGNQAWRYRVEQAREAENKFITVRQYFDRWGNQTDEYVGAATKQSKHVTPKWASNRASYIKTHVLPELGPKRLDALTTGHLTALQQRLLRKKLKPSTIDRVTHSALRGMLRDAMLDGYEVPDLKTLYDPTYITRLASDEDANPPDPYTPEERDRILEGFRQDDPGFYAFVFFRFWTGTRPSEAIALRHSFLNLKQRRFNVVASRVLGSDGRPKTRKSKRKVEIHANLADVLKDYVGSSRQDPDAFVFTTATGSPIDEANFYERHWKPMLLRLGIRKRPFYNTRHTYVTVMHVDLGMPPLWICRQTGMSLAMIENHYGGGQVIAEEIDARIAEHDASRNPAGTLRTRPAKGRAAQGRNAKKISALRRRAGDRGRTGDVQLGKLAFYR